MCDGIEPVLEVLLVRAGAGLEPGDMHWLGEGLCGRVGVVTGTAIETGWRAAELWNGDTARAGGGRRRQSGGVKTGDILVASALSMFFGLLDRRQRGESIGIID